MKVILIAIIIIATYLLFADWIMNNVKEILFSKEVLAAIIGAVVLIMGYIYSSNQQRQLEAYKIKANAYANALGQMELLLPQHKGETLKDNDKIQELNKYLSVALTYAPDCVVRKINETIFPDYKGDETTTLFGREEIRKIELIFHNDLNNKIDCSNKKILQFGDFLYFPFQ